GAQRPRLELRAGELCAARIPPPGAPARSRAGTALGRLLGGLALVRLLDAWSVDEPPAPPAPYGSEVVEALLRDLDARSHARGQLFLVAYLPGSWDPPERSRLFREWLGPFLERAAIPLVDLGPALLGREPSERRALFLEDGHYSARGQRAVAQAL